MAGPQPRLSVQLLGGRINRRGLAPAPFFISAACSPFRLKTSLSPALSLASRRLTPEVPPGSTVRIETRGLETFPTPLFKIVPVVGRQVPVRGGRNDHNDLAPVRCSAAGERSGTTGPFEIQRPIFQLGNPPSPTPERPEPPPAAHFLGKSTLGDG